MGLSRGAVACRDVTTPAVFAATSGCQPVRSPRAGEHGGRALIRAPPPTTQDPEGVPLRSPRGGPRPPSVPGRLLPAPGRHEQGHRRVPVQPAAVPAAHGHCRVPGEGPGGAPRRARGPQLPPAGADGAASPAASAQVFQALHSAGQSSTVRDWVMLSLSNFTQRSPVAMATWSLSCFFVSASTSPWVSAMYPCLVLGPGRPCRPVSILVDVCVSVLGTQVL